MKAVGSVISDGMVGLFTIYRDRTVITDIDNYHPIFDLPLPMIQNIGYSRGLAEFSRFG